MIFRSLRTKRQLQRFQETADPEAIATEKAALERENSEAPNKKSQTFLPTGIGTELMDQSYRGFRPVPALKPTDSSWKMRDDYEPEKFDEPKD